MHSVSWNRNGNWLLTASKDSLIKVYDIRMMKELFTLKGHKKEVTSKQTPNCPDTFVGDSSYLDKLSVLKF